MNTFQIIAKKPVPFDTSGHYEKRLSAAKDGKGTESSKTHHYSQCLPAKVHSVHPEGGVSNTTNLLLQGSFSFAINVPKPTFLCSDKITWHLHF